MERKLKAQAPSSGKKPPRVRSTTGETITADEAASRLGISKSSLYEALRKAEVPGLQIGGRWVLPRARFERFINGEELSATV
jgi:excisionase family DNA binding protein